MHYSTTDVRWAKSSKPTTFHRVILPLAASRRVAWSNSFAHVINQQTPEPNQGPKMFQYLLIIITTLAITLTSTIITAQQTTTSPTTQKAAQKLANLENKQINESSGLAVSRANPNLLWTHNDSGDKARIYAFNLQGKHIARYKLPGIKAIDFEDIAAFTLDKKHYLLIADTGDNARKRKYATLYITREPTVDLAAIPVKGDLDIIKIIRYTYPDGPHDCEAVAVDPSTKSIILISKQWSSTRNLEDDITCKVYTLSLVLTPIATPDSDPGQILTANHIATLFIPIVTAADISSDGRRAIVATYFNAFEFHRSENESWTAAFARPPKIHFLPLRRQGESIAYSPDAKSIYLTSEKRPTPLWQVKLPGKNID